MILSLTHCSSDKDKQLKGKIVRMSGLITINEKEASLGQIVKKGDLIKTEESDTSYVDVQFPDHHIRIKQGEMRVEAPEESLKLVLLRGKLYTAVTKLLKEDPSLVETPTAVMGVRGTKFFIEADEIKTYVCVCEGTVFGHLKDAPDIQKEIPTGYDLYLKSGEELTDPIESPDMVKMIYGEFIDMGFQAKEE